MAQNPHNTDLDRSPANFQPLTPLSFLERAATVFPGHTAIVHGPLRRSSAAFHARSRQMTSALAQACVGRGDTVLEMLANTPPMLGAHHGVPVCGAVLQSINTRLDAEIIAFQPDHAMAKVVIVDRDFMPLMQVALALTRVKPFLVQYDDPEHDGDLMPSDAPDHEAFLAAGDPASDWLMPEDEWDAISINHTSGTTGDPRGVVSHHRGAHFLAQGNALTPRLRVLGVTAIWQGARCRSSMCSRRSHGDRPARYRRSFCANGHVNLPFDVPGLPKRATAGAPTVDILNSQREGPDA